jgi:precorrin-8X/cobalt-precorrin-8 methylmutase
MSDRPVLGGMADGSLLARYGLPPAEIEARSLAYVEAQLADRLPHDPLARAVVVRMVYAAGDLTLVDAIRVHPALGPAALAALRAGAPVVVDGQMVAAAIARPALARLGCPVQVAVAAPSATARARALGTTRAAAGIALLAPLWAGGVVVIGTAPTALLMLLDLVAAGAPAPAAIIGTPVGFVAAAEASAALAGTELPHVTVLGTRGGAALAAAALNALVAHAAEQHAP